MAQIEASYTNLRVDGVVSVEPTKAKDLEGKSWRIVVVLIGPTGAGKSSFIEALASRASDKPLGIAKDQLESVTKTVEIYFLRNVTTLSGGYPVYLIDTPGFADPSISELQVLKDVQPWRDACNDRDAIRVLYFHPITDVRMPSSKRKCIEILKSFWGLYNLETFTLVTTMWNQVNPDVKQRAQERLKSVSADFWGDWSDRGSGLAVFQNTYESAMDILDMVMELKNRPVDTPATEGYGDPNEGKKTLVVEEVLHERIQGLRQQLQRIEEELQDTSDSTDNEELEMILRNDRENTLHLLGRFMSEVEHLRQLDVLPSHWRDTSSQHRSRFRKSLHWLKSHIEGLPKPQPGSGLRPNVV